MLRSTVQRCGPAPSPGGGVPKPVLRSLYRSVLREARKMDGLPITKTLLPMPKKLQEAAGLTAQLHMPDGVSYAQVAQKLFRDPALPLKTGFDALQTLRTHLSTIHEEMPRITRDHKTLLTILETAETDLAKYWAKPVPVPREAGALLKVPAPEGVDIEMEGEVQLSTIARMALLRRAGFELKVGTGLVAHPLSSAHSDRRVMLIVEKNPTTTTALVLDMLYSYPLSHGNPMFPEVLWGHEVHNGGYCHVDFTMPPTANVSVLHMLEPPAPESPSYTRWLRWAAGSKSAGGSGGGSKKDAETVRAQHEACCQPVIKSTAGGPNLYYSKVEALPYLATLAQGQPRDALRIYWGCMKWSTAQLVTEVAAGHWMPVELSPSFFGAYTVRNQSAPPAAPDAGAVSAEAIERFPSEDILREAKSQRERHFGADIAPPQVFPPTQPMCRREALWDQIMFALGGEYRQLVGCINPFASPRGEFSRVPPVAGMVDVSAAEPDRDGGMMVEDVDGIEDDLEHLSNEISLAEVGVVLRRAAERAQAAHERAKLEAESEKFESKKDDEDEAEEDSDEDGKQPKKKSSKSDDGNGESGDDGKNKKK